MLPAPSRGGSRFLTLYAQAFFRPKRAMASLVGAPHAVRYGFFATAVTGSTYLAVYFFLWHGGGRPTVFEPWLAIDPEVYYRYNLLLHVPTLLVAWVSAAGFAQLAARALGGSGRFETTLAVLGFGIGVATWATGLHDLITAFLGYVGVMDQRAYEDTMSSPGTFPHRLIWSLMALYLAAFLLLFTRGIEAAHRLSTLRALAVAMSAFGIYQVLFMVVNR